MSTSWTFPLCPQPPDFALDWPGLLDRFDWLEPLAECPQDTEWHAEGDVLAHTRLVAEALAADEDWRQLDATARSITFAAALLHDIAKPACTTVEGKRIVSPDHARKGMRQAQSILYQDWPLEEEPIPFAARQQIVALVRYHGLPLWLIDKPDMARAAIIPSLMTRNDWVALLARADALGRICPDTAELLGRIDLFREFCQEHHCLAQPYSFPSALSRYEYFRTPSRSPRYQAYDDTRMEVVLMSGLPGAGKNTWLDANLADWPVVSLDALRQEMGISPRDDQGAVVNRAKEMARRYLRQSQGFVWNATSVNVPIRQGLVEFFASYKACVRIVYIEATWPELVQRNQQRDAPVPLNVVRNFADRLDVPNLTEAHQVEWVGSAME